MTIDMSKVAPLSGLRGDDDAETEELRILGRQANDFIGSFAWCGEIRETFVGIAVPGVVGVFLVRIVPLRADVDPELWVIVGDVPPAYLVTDDAPTPVEALLAYAGLMREWVDAVNESRSISDLIPVNARPTKESASSLDSRLRFLVERVAPNYA